MTTFPSKQYHTIAKATQVIAILLLLAAVAVPVIRFVLDLPVTPMLPVVFLLAIGAAGLFVASGGAKKKAEEMENQG
jgi:hypothetical protein